MGSGEAREGRLTAGGLRFHYRAWGDAAAPPLLLLHGLWDTSALWEPVAPTLAHRYHVVAFDQRGHGGSDHASDYSLLRWVEDVDAVTWALGWERFSFVGHSLGAIFGFMFAARQPERVEKLVIVEHGPDATGEVRRLVARRNRTIEPPPPMDPALRLPDILDALDTPPMAHEWAMLPRITCPTLVVRSERSDRFSRETAERVTREIPNGRLVEIADTRHAIVKENPERLLRAVGDFL